MRSRTTSVRTERNPVQIQTFEANELPRGEKRTGWLDVASRPDGGAWRLPLLYVTGTNPGPLLLVTAGVHGNEYEGIEAIPRIFEQVQPDGLKGTLLMVSGCNMPAYEAGTRSSPVDGLNLARVFPGDAEGTISQRIAYWLAHKVIKPADLFIDLHSAGFDDDIPMMIGYPRLDDERGERALAAARAFGAPVLWGHPPSDAAGRSVSSADDFGIPWLYTETPGGNRSTRDDLACYIQGVLNVMIHLGMVVGQPQPRPMTHHLIGDGNLDTVTSAQEAGFFRPDVEPLDDVREGQRVGTIRDFFGEIAAEVLADRDGVVIYMRRTPRVRVGDALLSITGLLEKG